MLMDGALLLMLHLNGIFEEYRDVGATAHSGAPGLPV
jgi:hypothetical protein